MVYRGTLFSILLLTGILLILTDCANPVGLTGGPRDEREPQIDELRSTPNEQTNFIKKDIDIYFDEFVEIKDVFSNVVISPPLSKNPKINTRGKRLSIQFDEGEVLKEDATYVINFGEAIRDFTEGNIVKNHRFVFSTGDYIDSLSISGNVVDVKTGKPVEDIYVMLYDNLADSVVRTERPFYFSSTDKQGNYTIENLRADTFKIFALKDNNINYIYDQEIEMIAFQEELVVVGDSISGTYDLEAFVAAPKFSLKEKMVPNFGEIKLIFTKDVEKVEYKASIDGIEFKQDIDGDSLLLWYDNPVDTGFNLIVHHPMHDFHDTISIRKYRRADLIGKNKLALRTNSLLTGKLLMPFDSLAFKFSQPLDSINRDLISVIQDSMAVAVETEIDPNNNRRLIVKNNWLPDSTYQVILRKGSITDMYGRVADSLSQSFSIVNPSILSRVIIDYTELDTSINHVVLLKEGTKTIRSNTIVQAASGTVSFLRLLPKKYSIEVIRDDNKNGIWDPGDYDAKRQSELIYSRELEELRENWDLEVTLSSADFVKEIPIDTIQ